MKGNRERSFYLLFQRESKIFLPRLKQHHLVRFLEKYPGFLQNG